MPIDLLNFVRKWNASGHNEEAGAHDHFRDLCEALGVPHPTQDDEIGASYTYEKRVRKAGTGEQGFADVWKRGFFAWEYKSKGGDLKKAYKQLNEYHEALENPPLLVVCDFVRFEVHTKFENLPSRVYSFVLDDLLHNRDTATCALPPLEVLRHLFDDFNQLRPNVAAARVTEAAAADFLRLAQQLELERAAASQRAAPQPSKEQIAHFIMRLVFCLFADSVRLLPNHAFRRLVTNDRFSPIGFNKKLPVLFEAMSSKGGTFGADDIPYFNGGLFSDSTIIPLEMADLAILHSASQHDWSHIEPAIFGTLFERSLDAEKRSMIGAHYTSSDDILLLVEPVIVAPLQRRWHTVRQSVLEALAAEAAAPESFAPRLKLNRPALTLLQAWAAELSSVRILDPACGSGNFLYVALKRLLDLWQQARLFGLDHGLTLALDPIPHPGQLFGIEIDFYAHEIASIVVWIGFLQWKHDHGVKDEKQPLLEKLTNIQKDNAILRYDAKDQPYEPEWPQAEYIVSNPPFLGGQFIRRHLGDQYVEDLFTLYGGRVRPSSDLVTYWFERARFEIERNPSLRAGLLATQSIRNGVNRLVLARIADSGGIFYAWSDREWVLNGAAVRISMIGFDDGSEQPPQLNGEVVEVIHSNLSSGLNLTQIESLDENADLAFQGPVKVGKFEISSADASRMLRLQNVHGLSNSQVVKPWFNGTDITDRPQHRAIIDFGKRTEAEAALYEAPFELLRQVVLPKRRKNRDPRRRENWWRLGASGSTLSKAAQGLKRMLVTSRVSKHRFFVWAPAEAVPDTRVVAIVTDLDYFCGVLHSEIHQTWFHLTSSRHGDGKEGGRPTYNPTTCFDTFPFPWPPGTEPSEADSPLIRDIAEAARTLVRLRDNWLNPPGASGEDLRTRTLTRLYNLRAEGKATWLENAHRTLDAAVFAAYGWPYPLPTQEILARLLTLNHARAATQTKPAKLDKKPRRKPSSSPPGPVPSPTPPPS